MDGVDLNAIAQGASDDLTQTAADVHALAVQTEQLVAQLTPLVAKASAFLDMLQAAAKEALIVEQDADGTIKNVKFKWPLA
ncbi:MAG: hypothetical protein ACLQGT_05070 [Terracidiphilus sp.]